MLFSGIEAKTLAAGAPGLGNLFVELPDGKRSRDTDDQCSDRHN